MKICPWIYIIVYIIVCPSSPSNGANILVFAPMPMKSHFKGFQPLFRELALKGHNVTVVSSFPLEKPMKNYNEIVIPINKTAERGQCKLLNSQYHFEIYEKLIF